MSSKPEVVISGIGGVFPNSVDLNDFKDILLENKNTVDQGRWVGSSIVEVDGIPYYNHIPNNRHSYFDATFFSVHSSQALYLDPITRVLLEKTFEALLDAGVNPIELRGKNIPIISGACISETDVSIFEPVKKGFGITGQARGMVANRVSYWLNVNGPSICLDNTWNSGIQVLELAMQYIQDGGYDSAIVSASSLSITPCVQWHMDQSGLLCKDGVTRPYVEGAKGYSRGDGLVVMYLQRSDVAKRTYATLLYSHAIFDGISPGELSHCNPDKFSDFLEECYKKSGVDPKDVAYLETYGCGLKEIDENELVAVERVFCRNRSGPLQIGSVKTNIGHTEPASALMSLIKIIIAMETGTLPAHLNFDKSQTKIPALLNGKLEVVTENREWNGSLAAINCIGFASSYGHIIIRGNKQPRANITTDLPLLITYSTRTEEGIQKINESVSAQPSDLYYNRLVHDVFSKNINGHLYRAYDLRATKQTTTYKHYSGEKPPIWFVYSGMGSQWKTMGRDLLKLPVFANAVYKCHNALQPKGVDLLRIITEDDDNIFENILNSFVGIAAVQIGLTDVLNSVGIYPDGLIGHSVGELGCAYADNCLTAEQMILSAYYRGKASLDADLVPGMMAAVGMGHSKLKHFCPEKIDIACHNSEDSCTISGPAQEVTKFVEILKSKRVFAKLVNVSNIAYHSRYIKPAAPHLLSYLKEVIPNPKPRSSKWICTSVPQSKWNTDLAKTVSPEYLTNNLLSSVLFEEGLPFVPNNAVTIEIAPHGLLQAILRRALPKTAVNIPLTKRDTNNLDFLFNALGQLYLNGVDTNLTTLYPSIPLPVPTGTPSLCNLVQWEHSIEWSMVKADEYLISSERDFVMNFNSTKFQHFNKCRIDNRIFLPHAIYFGLISEMVKNDDLSSITFEDILFKNHIEVNEGATVTITISLQPGTRAFEITNEQKIIATGKIVTNNKEKITTLNVENNKNLASIKENNFYKELEIKGYKYADELKMVSSIDVKENGFSGYIKPCENWKDFIGGAFQAHLFYNLENSQHLILPKYVQRVHITFGEFDKEKEPVAWYNNQIGTIESNIGVQITGLNYERFKINNKAVNIENLHFVNHIDNNEDIRINFNMLTKLVMETENKNLTIIELKEKYSPKYLPYVKNYLNQKEIEAKTIELNDIDYSLLRESSLTIISGKYINIISQIITNISSYVLLCFPVNYVVSLPNKYTTFAQFSSGKNKFILIKEVNKMPVKVINIKDDNLSYKNMQNNSNPWTQELNTSLLNEKRIFLVSSVMPLEGIPEFVTQMRNNTYGGAKLRFLFILDPKAPVCRPEEEFYKRVFEQDLVVQVFKNRNWGSYVDAIETSEIGKVGNNSSLMRALNSNVISNKYNLSYIGLHPKDLTRIDDDSIPCEMGVIDFSGTTESGERIMGFAQTYLNESKLEIDPEFVWTVPKTWSLTDAATMPYAFTMAYYTLFTVGSLSENDVVLVHAGSTQIGLAATHIAYNYGCTVYTTVANDKQRCLMKKWLPLIPEEYILDSESTNFESEILLKTYGNGVNIVLNCLPGDRFKVSLNLMNTFGKFIQLGSHDLKSYNTIGMKNFLNCMTLYAVSGQGLLQLPQETKKELHDMMLKDMAGNDKIVPLPRKIVTENRGDETLRYLRSSTVMGTAVIKINNEIYKGRKSMCNKIQNQDTYLVYANSNDSIFSIIQYLIKQGGKSIIISNVPNKNLDFVNRFISSIKQNYDIDIIISKHNASSVESAKLLVKEIASYGNLSDMFIFANPEDNLKIFGNLDTALNQNKQEGRMVCIFGNNKERAFFRKSGLPVCNISWGTTYDFQDVVRNLDVILSKEDNDVVYLKDDVDEKDQNNNEIGKDDSMFLPNNLKTLKHMGQCEVRSPCLTQLVSHIPQELRDCPPVFLVPGLAGPHCPLLRQFVSQLMHPVFCVQLPSNAIPDDLLDDLAQQIRSVRKMSTYRFIGVSWGGLLAIELAKKLQSLGYKTELHLIDGLPKIIYSFTNTFNKSGVFNTSRLKQVLKIDGKSIEQILSNDKLSKFDYKDIVRSLTILKNLIEYTNSYKPLQFKIQGQTYVTLPDSENPEENLGLSEHCEQIRYKVLRGNHRTILQNKMLPDFVNDNLM